jgi:hypothetical protein
VICTCRWKKNKVTTINKKGEDKKQNKKHKNYI